MMPCYMPTSGEPVNWIEDTVVAVGLHRGLEPTAGHYQCLLQTRGGRFLCGEDRVAISVPHLQAMGKDVYLVWLTRTVNLTAPFAPWSADPILCQCRPGMQSLRLPIDRSLLIARSAGRE